MADLHTTTERLINVNDEIPSETMMPLKNMGDDTLLINFVCTNLPFSVRDKIKLLQIGDISQRLMELLKLENRDIQLNELKNQIRQKTHEDLDEQQKEYFLQQQMKNIREELGSDGGSTEKRELEEKAKNKKWPDEVAKLFKKELDKLDNSSKKSLTNSICSMLRVRNTAYKSTISNNS